MTLDEMLAKIEEEAPKQNQADDKGPENENPGEAVNDSLLPSGNEFDEYCKRHTKK